MIGCLSFSLRILRIIVGRLIWILVGIGATVGLHCGIFVLTSIFSSFLFAFCISTLLNQLLFISVQIFVLVKCVLP